MLGLGHGLEQIAVRGVALAKEAGRFAGPHHRFELIEDQQAALLAEVGQQPVDAAGRGRRQVSPR
ncbi:MAG: hypothetical protein HZY76_00210 [Anaerolineae bacterium]|nr:MAG: hypothetical protein HZY76_00210 [Anaerolineae bacterium]